MFKHFSEENKQTILNSNLEQLPLEVKETLIKQIAHEYAIANNIPLKINMYEELKFQEGYASKEGKTYTTNISKSYRINPQ